jgi:hypothetical protein
MWDRVRVRVLVLGAGDATPQRRCRRILANFWRSFADPGHVIATNTVSSFADPFFPASNAIFATDTTVFFGLKKRARLTDTVFFSFTHSLPHKDCLFSGCGSTR